MSIFEHVHSFVAKRGKGGKTAAQSRRKKQPRFVGEIEACGQDIKQPNQETAHKVDSQRRIRKQKRRDTSVQQRLHTVTQQTTGSAADKYRHPDFYHKGRIVMLDHKNAAKL